ncbi:MAG TPA: ATP-binding protein [Candidatus Binataceae bacterium]|nr:ATP-binding protein [Candidatus Binataceae bacterium]
MQILLVIVAALLLGVLAGYALRGASFRQLAALRDRIRELAAGDELSAAALGRRMSMLAAEINAAIGRVSQHYAGRLSELDHERSKIDAIVESVEDGLIVLDQDRAIVHINEVACAILAMESRPAAGTVLESLAAQNPHVARLIAARRDSDDKAPAEFKIFLRGRDHTYISRELPWTGPGDTPLGTILLLQDVTFIRDQERQRTNLIATLSHELKTPLTSLNMGAELMEESMRENMTNQQRELLETIHDDIGRMTAIAGNLLDASRTTVARIGVERRAIQLDRVVREACRPLGRQADEKNIRLEIIADSKQPLAIWGDPIKLPWVITNLVGNSLRYTPPGGQIRIELRREGKVARTVVSDTGKGIAPEMMPRIFEPYAQSPDHPGEMGSAGLGLYIAKEIVEAHNGRIFASSAPGEGTTFTIDIPIREELLGQDPGR